MAQKYIIGDLVRYTSLYKEPIAEICEIRETSYLIRYMNGNFAKVTNEEINPIPITPEILEKNGWEKEKYGLVYYKKVSETLYFRLIGKSYGWTLRCGNQNLIEILEFIHQLQHLLFGLGINHEMEV